MDEDLEGIFVSVIAIDRHSITLSYASRKARTITIIDAAYFDGEGNVYGSISGRQTVTLSETQGPVHFHFTQSIGNTCKLLKVIIKDDALKKQYIQNTYIGSKESTFTEVEYSYHYVLD